MKDLRNQGSPNRVVKADTKGIFLGENRLTEEATVACRINNISMDEIVNRPFDYFKRPGRTIEQTEKIYAANKKKRQGLLFII